MTYAKIIADSITDRGDRLTTMEVRIHRFVLAEFNTHRVFSRNSASSRAIPLAKQIERVQTDPASPLVWPAEQRGMQGGESLSDEAIHDARDEWSMARDDAVRRAAGLHQLGPEGDEKLHKSLPNRLLEPFMWQTIVVTATAWENFFAQRCSPLAQPEIRAAAEMMQDAYLTSTPRLLKEGEWHLPYVESEDWEALSRLLKDQDEMGILGRSMYSWMVKISAARCARVSYLTQDGKRDISEDLDLYDRLDSADPPHWSPLEHVATPWPDNHQENVISFGEMGHYGEPVLVRLDHLPKVGNLLGWRSMRTTVEAQRGQVTYA